ncbi:MAG: very short patch repair endonuclease [Acidobacteriota bacterium]
MDRSANMRAIRSKDMAPELAVRHLVHKMGYRFRLHRKELPGKPDMVFVSRRKVIFVHGCFWHSHGCKSSHVPRSNLEYWLPKLRRNQIRDGRNQQALAADGWKCLVVWECETRDAAALKRRIVPFLDKRRSRPGLCRERCIQNEKASLSAKNRS